jgi:hypothetical protein
MTALLIQSIYFPVFNSCNINQYIFLLCYPPAKDNNNMRKSYPSVFVTFFQIIHPANLLDRSFCLIHLNSLILNTNISVSIEIM